MPEARPPAPRDRLAEPTTGVEISVVVHRDRGRLRRRVHEIRFPRHQSFVAILVLMAGALGAVVSDVPVTRAGGAQRPVNPRASERGAPGVAAADGHPLRCLSITIAPHHPAYARADFNDAVACGRFGGYATAIFRRVRGMWRPALYTLHFSCPAPYVPRAIQAELAVCP
jgi:hypothetical protein